MIRYNPTTWNLLLLFKGSMLKRLFGGMLFVGILTTVLCFLHLEYKIFNLEVSSALPGYMGAALGLLLVFRNNTAYDKWWEGRKVLGGLVNVSRNIAININQLVPKDEKERTELYKLLIGFVYANKEHLRHGVKMEELQNLEWEDLKKVKGSLHKPNKIADLMLEKVNILYKKKLLNDMQQYLFIKNINTLIDLMGMCERIKKTPIPIAYAFLLKFFIVIYVVMLPFGLLNELGWALIPLAIVLYYIMMSIVMTAEEIEDPFGHELNDLPVDEIARNIEKNVLEIVGGGQTKPVISSSNTELSHPEVS